MSKDEAGSPDDGSIDRRYRIDQPDGTWWELGWDQRLGTYFAQEHSPEPFDPFTVDQPTTWFGTRPSEVPSTAVLVEQLDIDVPDDVLAELERDASAVPDVIDPQAQADTAVHRRTTLPAADVVDTLHRLQRDPYLAAEDIHTFAVDLGLGRELASGMLDGTIEDLEVDQIAHVCEALHCSPYDLWGVELGREILDAYGPEQWPRHIEPLNDGRGELDDTFIRRRIEQQAAGVLRIVEPMHPQLEVEATRFRQTAVLAVTADGQTSRVMDTLQPADDRSEYHFAFQRLARPEMLMVPMSSAEFAGGPPPGAGVAPALIDALRELDQARPGTDMVRLRDPATEAEQWLGRDTPFDDWQTWDDPRRYYPGDPTDVLDERVLELPTLPLETPSIDVREFEGAGLDV
jgi:hypothetical protein